MADLASLIINIKALGASKAADDLNKVTNSGKQTEVQSDKLTRSTDNLAKAYSALRTSTAAYVAYSAIKTITQTGLEFDRMERSLFAATGSMEAARVEMKFLRDETNRVGVNLLSTGKMYAQLTAAAKGTTISQAEVRDIFTSVSEASVVLGLSADDTKGAVRALVQVMSKGKVQAEELRGQLGERFPGAFQAAARAMGLTVAEMSKMLEQGNVISDEFIPKFAAEIRRTYAAAVPEAMESAQAAFARFHNAMAEAENEIAQGGLLDALATAATFTADVTNSLIDQVKTTSEWAAALSTGQISFWEWMTTGADDAAERLKELKAEMKDIETGGEIRMPMPPRPSDKPQKSAGQLREEERAAKRAEKEFDTLVASLRKEKEEIEYNYQERMRILDEHVDKGTQEYENYSQRIIDIRNGELSEIEKANKTDINNLISALQTEEEAVQASYDKRMKIINNSQFDSPEAKQDVVLRVTEDRDKQLADIKESKMAEFNAVVDGLQSEEEEVLASYNRRREIILNNTEETSTKRHELLTKLDKEFASDAIGVLAEPDTYQEQLDEIQSFYDRKRELILSNTEITEAQRAELEERLSTERNERLQALEMARQQTILSAGQDLFGSLADLSKQFAGEQSGVYKAMFAASKAFAIADAIIKIQQGIASAASMPWPSNLAAMASVAASTAGIVSTISGTNYSGAYDAGGYIPGGSVGLVGEVGPELVSGPANVTSRKDTAALLNKEQAPPPPPVNNIRIVNAFDSAVVGDYLGSDAGEQAVLNVVKRNQSTIQQMMA